MAARKQCLGRVQQASPKALDPRCRNPGAIGQYEAGVRGQRAFELPASVDRGKIAADFSKGVLTITLPKTVEAQQPTKKIAVKAS